MQNDEKLLLKIKNIVKEFKIPCENLFFSKKIIIALDNVSLSLKYGESFGIVGESGSGKSTLARTIMGLEEIKSGEILFMGKNLNYLSKKDLRIVRKSLQMIFQDPYGSLDPKNTIEKIISEPLALTEKISPNQKRIKVSDVMEKVGLSPNDMNKYPHEFSGGQRQRIAIARSLITRPALIVADEPVSALDVSVQAQVLNLMMDLREENGLAYLFISHDLSVVRQITSKIAVMFSGKIIEMGTTEDLFNNPLHPYTKSLIEAIPIPDPKRKIINQKTFFNFNTENSKLLAKSTNGCSYAPYCYYAIDKCKNVSPLLNNVTKEFFKNFSNNTQSFNHRVACHNPLN